MVFKKHIGSYIGLVLFAASCLLCIFMYAKEFFTVIAGDEKSALFACAYAVALIIITLIIALILRKLSKALYLKKNKAALKAERGTLNWDSISIALSVIIFGAGAFAAFFSRENGKELNFRLFSAFLMIIAIRTLGGRLCSVISGAVMLFFPVCTSVSHETETMFWLIASAGMLAAAMYARYSSDPDLNYHMVLKISISIFSGFFTGVFLGWESGLIFLLLIPLFSLGLRRVSLARSIVFFITYLISAIFGFLICTGGDYKPFLEFLSGTFRALPNREITDVLLFLSLSSACLLSVWAFILGKNYERVVLWMFLAAYAQYAAVCVQRNDLNMQGFAVFMMCILITSSVSSLLTSYNMEMAIERILGAKITNNKADKVPKAEDKEDAKTDAVDKEKEKDKESENTVFSKEDLTDSKKKVETDNGSEYRRDENMASVKGEGELEIINIRDEKESLVPEGMVLPQAEEDETPRDLPGFAKDRSVIKLKKLCKDLGLEAYDMEGIVNSFLKEDSISPEDIDALIDNVYGAMRSGKLEEIFEAAIKDLKKINSENPDTASDIDEHSSTVKYKFDIDISEEDDFDI